MFDNPPLVKHVNHVGFLDRAEAVRDGDGGSALGGSIESSLDDLLGLGVEGRGGFVEEEDLGVAKEGAGDGDALLLAAGEHAAFAADDGVEAVSVGNN